MAKITSLKINNVDYELSGGGLVIIDAKTATFQDVYDAYISTGNVRLSEGTFFENVDFAHKDTYQNQEYISVVSSGKGSVLNGEKESVDYKYVTNLMIGTPTDSLNKIDRIDITKYMEIPTLDNPYDIFEFETKTSFFNVEYPPKYTNAIRITDPDISYDDYDNYFSANAGFIKKILGINNTYYIFQDLASSFDDDFNPIKYHTTPQSYMIAVGSDNSHDGYLIKYFKMLVYLKEDIIGPKTFRLGGSAVYLVHPDSPAIEVIDVLTGNKVGTCDMGQYFSSGSSFVLIVPEGITIHKDHPYLIATEPLLSWKYNT